MKSYFEEEENASLNEAVVVEESVPKEDPSVAKRGKGAKVGLMIPAIILTVIGSLFCLFTWLLYSSANELIHSGDAAEAIIGGLFVLVIYFAALAVSFIANIPPVILSIVCISKKNTGNKVLPIVVLSIAALEIISLITSLVMLYAIN